MSSLLYPYSEEPSMNINNLRSKITKIPGGTYGILTSVGCELFKIEPNQVKRILGEECELVITHSSLRELIYVLAKQDNLQAKACIELSIDEWLQPSSTESSCISEKKEDCRQLLENKQAGTRKRQVTNNPTKNNQLTLVYPQKTPNCSEIESNLTYASVKRDPKLTFDGNDTKQKTKRTQKDLISLAHKAGLILYDSHRICVFCNILSREWKKIVYNMSDEKIIECLKVAYGPIMFASEKSGANGGKTRSTGFESAIAIVLLCSDINVPDPVMRNLKNAVCGYDHFLHTNKFEQKYLSEYPVGYGYNLRNFLIDAKKHPNSYQENDETQLEFEQRTTLYVCHNYIFNKNGPLVLPQDRLYDMNPSFTPDILYSLLDS